jgi:hypothetical protein
MTKTGTNADPQISIRANVAGTWVTPIVDMDPGFDLALADTFLIGRHDLGVNGHAFDGTIDDVAIYDTALSLETIESHFSARQAGPIEMPMTNFSVAASSTLQLDTTEVALLANLTLADGVELTVAGDVPAIGFQGLSGGSDSSIVHNAMLVIRGQVAPGGDSVGNLETSGQVMMGDGSSYEVDLARSSHDSLSVGAVLDLDPEGDRQTALNFVVHGGDETFQAGTYTLITAGEEIVGTFTTSEGLGDYVTDGGLDYAARTLKVTVDYDLHPGDANLDTKTNVLDFNVWNSSKFTGGTTWIQGDFNNDGKTNVLDFNVWNAAKFTSASAAGPLVEGQVPEPSVLALLAAGSVGWLLLRRRRCA